MRRQRTTPSTSGSGPVPTISGQFRLLRWGQARLGATVPGILEPVRASRVEAVNPVTQGLAVHAAGPGRIFPAHSPPAPPPATTAAGSAWRPSNPRQAAATPLPCSPSASSPLFPLARISYRPKEPRNPSDENPQESPIRTFGITYRRGQTGEQVNVHDVVPGFDRRSHACGRISRLRLMFAQSRDLLFRKPASFHRSVLQQGRPLISAGGNSPSQFMTTMVGGIAARHLQIQRLCKPLFCNLPQTNNLQHQIPKLYITPRKYS